MAEDINIFSYLNKYKVKYFISTVMTTYINPPKIVMILNLIFQIKEHAMWRALSISCIQ